MYTIMIFCQAGVYSISECLTYTIVIFCQAGVYSI